MSFKYSHFGKINTVLFYRWLWIFQDIQSFNFAKIAVFTRYLMIIFTSSLYSAAENSIRSSNL